MVKRFLNPQIINGIPEVSCEDVMMNVEQVTNHKIKLVDVRQPDEFNGELGHINSAQMVTLGPSLIEFLEKGNRDEEIVFVCRSGGRSAAATFESINRGYKRTANMTGGMLRWNQIGLAVEKK